MQTAISASRPRRLLVIFNPTAGWRRRRRLAAVLDALRRRGCAVELRETAAPGDAVRLAREAAGGRAYDAIVAAGGDGTINEVIAGIGEADAVLGIVPLGTANVLAAEIGLPTAPEAVAAVLAAGAPRTVHLGVANGRRFAVTAGVGFDAHVVRDFSRALKRWTGKLAYVWQSLVELARLAPARYRVAIDGETHGAAAVIVAKGHYYGGRFICAPEARLDEPELHVVLFERAGRRHALRYIWGTLAGRLGRFPDVRVVRARRLAIDGPPGDPVQGDGDIIATLPAEIAVAPGRLRLLWPE